MLDHPHQVTRRAGGPVDGLEGAGRALDFQDADEGGPEGQLAVFEEPLRHRLETRSFRHHETEDGPDEGVAHEGGIGIREADQLLAGVTIQGYDAGHLPREILGGVIDDGSEQLGLALEQRIEGRRRNARLPGDRLDLGRRIAVADEGLAGVTEDRLSLGIEGGVRADAGAVHVIRHSLNVAG